VKVPWSKNVSFSEMYFMLCSPYMTAMCTELHICSLNSSHLALMHVFYNILLLKVNVEHQRKRWSLWSII